MNVGPVSIAVQADKPVFRNYVSGIMNDEAGCGKFQNHAVLAIGYGVDHGQEYWIVRNSWGSSWGDQGHIKIGNSGKNDAGICGINGAPAYPLTKPAL